MRISDWSSDVCSSDLIASAASGGAEGDLDRYRPLPLQMMRNTARDQHRVAGLQQALAPAFVVPVEADRAGEDRKPPPCAVLEVVLAQHAGVTVVGAERTARPVALGAAGTGGTGAAAGGNTHNNYGCPAPRDTGRI